LIQSDKEKKREEFCAGKGKQAHRLESFPAVPTSKKEKNHGAERNGKREAAGRIEKKKKISVIQKINELDGFVKKPHSPRAFVEKEKKKTKVLGRNSRVKK